MTQVNRACLLLLLIAVFCAATFGTVRHGGGDPKGALLVSESILTHGTIRLDHYGPEILSEFTYQLYQKNGHTYYYFPLGTSLFSLPFVAIAKGWGFSMARSELAVQMAINSVVAVATAWLLARLAMLFLAPRNALAAAAVFWFGTSFASSAGTALWSHNFAALFALLAVYLTIRAAKVGDFRLWPMVSVALFSAYLCRPTLSLLAPFVIIFIFLYCRTAAIKTALLFVLALALFVLFSLSEFRDWLPDYYLPTRLGGVAGDSFWVALFGNLLSPARGLLVYSPFMVIVWLCLRYSRKAWLPHRWWLLIAFLWPVVHLFSISRFPHWWGGGSYGPRLMTDALPGIFLLTLYPWPTTVSSLPSKISIFLLSLSSAFSVWVNTCQGIFNTAVIAEWYTRPSVDIYPARLFDYAYPQFLARPRPGKEFAYDDDDLKFINWCEPEPKSPYLLGYRWSCAYRTSIRFPLKKKVVSRSSGRLMLAVHSLGAQRMELNLNGIPIYAGVVTPAHFYKNIVIEFDPKLLQVGFNELVFSLPGAHSPGPHDKRLLSLALRGFFLY